MIIEIEEKLKDFVSEIVKDYSLFSVKGDLKKINIFRGMIPSEKAGEIIPAIAIRVNKGNNSLENRTLNIHLVFETTNQDTEKGYEEHVKVLQEIIDKVISKGTVGDIAEILPEAKWEISEEIEYPYFVSEINFKIISRKAYRTDADEWIYGE